MIINAICDAVHATAIRAEHVTLFIDLSCPAEITAPLASISHHFNLKHGRLCSFLPYSLGEWYSRRTLYDNHLKIALASSRNLEEEKTLLATCLRHNIHLHILCITEEQTAIPFLLSTHPLLAMETTGNISLTELLRGAFTSQGSTYTSILYNPQKKDPPQARMLSLHSLSHHLSPSVKTPVLYHTNSKGIYPENGLLQKINKALR